MSAVGRPMTRQRSAWEPSDPGHLRGLLGEHAQVWQRPVSDGHLTAIVSRDADLWHLSISHRTNHQPPRPGRYPRWDEISHARYALLPEHLTFAMLLPPPDEYVAVHDTTFHLWEINDPRGGR